MNIRPAVPGDARELAEVHVAAWQAAYRGLMPDSVLAGLTVEKRTILWQRTLAQPGAAALLVAESDKSLAGFCFFGPTRDEDGRGRSVGEIIALNLRPEYWRQGTGRNLCDHALREAAIRAWTSVTLWVLKGNERASRFCEALGFSLDGAERTDIKLTGFPLLELRYRKSLSR